MTGRFAMSTDEHGDGLQISLVQSSQFRYQQLRAENVQLRRERDQLIRSLNNERASKAVSDELATRLQQALHDQQRTHKDEIDSKDRIARDVTGENTKLRDRITSLEEENSRLRGQLTLLQSRVEALEKDISRITAEHQSELDDLKESHQDQLDSIKLQLQDMQSNKNLMLVRQMATSFQHKAAIFTEMQMKDTKFAYSVTLCDLEKAVGKKKARQDRLEELLGKCTDFADDVDELARYVKVIRELGTSNSHPTTTQNEDGKTVEVDETSLSAAIAAAPLSDEVRGVAQKLLPALQFLATETKSSILASGGSPGPVAPAASP